MGIIAKFTNLVYIIGMEPLIQPVLDLVALFAVVTSLVTVAIWTTNNVVRVFLSWTGFIQDDL